MVTLCLIFGETAELLFKAAAPFYILTSNGNSTKVPVSLHTCQQLLLLSAFLIIAILMNVK